MKACIKSSADVSAWAGKVKSIEAVHNVHY